MLVGFCIFQFLPDKLLGLFAASDAMLAIGVPALRIICPTSCWRVPASC